MADPAQALPLQRSTQYFTNTVMGFDESKVEGGLAKTINAPIFGCVSRYLNVCETGSVKFMLEYVSQEIIKSGIHLYFLHFFGTVMHLWSNLFFTNPKTPKSFGPKLFFFLLYVLVKFYNH